VTGLNIILQTHVNIRYLCTGISFTTETYMYNLAPIVIVDDDPDDQDMIKEVCTMLEIKNKLVWFSDGQQVLDYLIVATEQPFLILCDVNMPKIDGLTLRKIINDDVSLRDKAIPFVFLSTTANQVQVNSAYKMTVQGFFEKGNDFERLKRKIELIFEYWNECKHPNSFLKS
jgi:CheY-like chemotaxis protein